MPFRCAACRITPRKVYFEADPQGFQGRDLRADGGSAAGEETVRREVTRVVTPGTAADSSLSSEENNFLAAVAQSGRRVGFAALDLSTGEFRATEFHGEDAGRRIQEELQQLRPKEIALRLVRAAV